MIEFVHHTGVFQLSEADLQLPERGAVELFCGGDFFGFLPADRTVSEWVYVSAIFLRPPGRARRYMAAESVFRALDDQGFYLRLALADARRLLANAAPGDCLAISHLRSDRRGDRFAATLVKTGATGHAVLLGKLVDHVPPGVPNRPCALIPNTVLDDILAGKPIVRSAPAFNFLEGLN